MSLNNEVATLKSKIQSNDPHALSAITHLIELDRSAALDYLITLLNSTDPELRNLSALGLRDLADNGALEPLFVAIMKPENVNSRGTLVYALETLNCSAKFSEMFDLLFYGNYEVKVGAATILEDQEFEFSKVDLLVIQDKWTHIQLNPNLCPDYDKCRADIEDLVSSYLNHLVN